MVRQAFHPCPGYHRRIVGAEPGGWDVDRKALSFAQFGQRFADGLIGGNPASHDKCISSGKIAAEHFHRDAAAVAQNIDHRGLKAGAGILNPDVFLRELAQRRLQT